MADTQAIKIADIIRDVIARRLDKRGLVSCLDAHILGMLMINDAQRKLGISISREGARNIFLVLRKIHNANPSAGWDVAMKHAEKIIKEVLGDRIESHV